MPEWQEQRQQRRQRRQQRRQRRRQAAAAAAAAHRVLFFAVPPLPLPFVFSPTYTIVVGLVISVNGPVAVGSSPTTAAVATRLSKGTVFWRHYDQRRAKCVRENVPEVGEG